MLGFLIVLFFLISIAVGVFKGAILQGIHVIGLFIGYILTILFYDNLVNFVSLWVPYVGFDIENTFTYFPQTILQNMDVIYFRLCAMLIIILATWIVTEIVAYLCRNLKFVAIDIPANLFLGGIFGLISAWFWSFFILTFLSVLTFQGVQTALANSPVADFIIRNTPLLSRQVFHLLLQGIGNLPF